MSYDEIQISRHMFWHTDVPTSPLDSGKSLSIHIWWSKKVSVAFCILWTSKTIDMWLWTIIVIHGQMDVYIWPDASKSAIPDTKLHHACMDEHVPPFRGLECTLVCHKVKGPDGHFQCCISRGTVSPQKKTISWPNMFNFAVIPP